MSLAADQADLDAVNLAISRIESSLTQEHWVGGDRHRAPELRTLYEERDRLRRKVAAGTRGGAKLRPVRFVR